MPLSKTEKIHWKSGIEEWLSSADSWFTDSRGFIHKKKRTGKMLAEKMKVHYMTVYRWRKTGAISPHFRRELIRQGVVRKDWA